MKKRILFVVVMLFTVLTVSLLAGCVKQGKSAYEIACENGFTGTEQQWLESLNGRDGIDAPPIDFYALYDEYLRQYPDAAFADFLATLSVSGYTETEYAAAVGIQSVVSIFSTFTDRATRIEFRGAGAGVAYKVSGDDIYIITNYHVVYDRESTGNGVSSNIKVYSYGFEWAENEVAAEFVGGSISKDIAVIKASLADFSGNLRPAVIGDSNSLSLGEKTVAIGNPSAEGISVSAGVISVDSENIQMEALDSAYNTVTLRVIRTDSAINKGNSGGGLFNARGELIGIVNAKTIESGVENIGFAIPSSVATGIADCIIENDAKKCLLGITSSILATQTYYNAAKNRVEIVEIISVSDVTSGALAHGKIFKNDKLLSASINDGESFMLTRIFHLSDYLYKARMGDTIHLEVERNGEIITVDLTPAAKDHIAV